MVCSDGIGNGIECLHRDIWNDRVTTSKLAVPALCYTVQNNLVFVAVGNLSAAAAQVLFISIYINR